MTDKPSLFRFENQEVVVGDLDGSLTAEEVTAMSLLEIRNTLWELTETMKRVDHTLRDGEVKIHRTQ